MHLSSLYIYTKSRRTTTVYAVTNRIIERLSWKQMRRIQQNNVRLEQTVYMLGVFVLYYLEYYSLVRKREPENLPTLPLKSTCFTRLKNIPSTATFTTDCSYSTIRISEKVVCSPKWDQARDLQPNRMDGLPQCVEHVGTWSLQNGKWAGTFLPFRSQELLLKINPKFMYINHTKTLLFLCIC